MVYDSKSFEQEIRAITNDVHNANIDSLSAKMHLQNSPFYGLYREVDAELDKLYKKHGTAAPSEMQADADKIFDEKSDKRFREHFAAHLHMKKRHMVECIVLAAISVSLIFSGILLNSEMVEYIGWGSLVGNLGYTIYSLLKMLRKLEYYAKLMSIEECRTIVYAEMALHNYGIINKIFNKVYIIIQKMLCQFALDVHDVDPEKNHEISTELINAMNIMRKAGGLSELNTKDGVDENLKKYANEKGEEKNETSTDIH